MPMRRDSLNGSSNVVTYTDKAYPEDRMGEREVRVATGEAGEEQAALDKLEAAR